MELPLPDQNMTKKDEKNKWTIKKHLLISSAILTSTAAICKVAGDLIGGRLYNLAIARNDKTELTEALKQSDLVKIEIPQFINDRLKKRTELADAFVQAHPPESLFRRSDDGLKLHAYRFNVYPGGHRWAVPLHGYMDQGTSMFYFAAKFAQQGFNVLVPDLRGAGKSEGDYIGMGWNDRLDVVGWIQALVDSDPMAKIFIHGVSMGGATAMMTAGERLPDNVVAVVEDCGYSSVADEFIYELRNLYSLPPFPLMQLADRAIRSRAGFSIYEASSIEQLKKAKVPVLFIHGAEDTFVPAEMVHKVFEAAPCEKELLIVEGAPHGASSVVDPERYFSTLFSFVESHMKNKKVG